jgi:arylsulfatase A-like enzyme
VWSPTRFGLYTGRYPGRLTGGLQEPIGQPTEIDGIPIDHPTLASLLKGVGYDTALIGKWQCGYLPWFSPTRVGWDEFFGNSAAVSTTPRSTTTATTTSSRTKWSMTICATTPRSSPSEPWSSSSDRTIGRGC